MLDLAYRFLFPALWMTWVAFWLLTSRRVKTTERRERFGSGLLHLIPLMVAFELLWSNRIRIGVLNYRLFPRAPWVFWAAALVTAAGLGFAIWARIHIGRNWSATVTIKKGHELITTGPYSLVRHPIYTGLLVAFLGSALARGQWRGVLALAIAWAALWWKLRIEERWMFELFGEEYAAYQQRVPALIPFTK